MKVRDLLKIVFDNQYIEFNYIDEDGDFTAYDRPIYVYKERENIESKDYEYSDLLDKEVITIYSETVIDFGDVLYDYLVVVLKEDK